MFGKRETEVLVAGAGPVGMYAALLLAERGIRVQVVDEQFRGTTRSYALALHPRSLELLDELGLASELVASGRRVDTVILHGGSERRAEVRLGETGSRYPFVLVLPQSALEEALERRLASRGVGVDWSHRLARLELDDAGVTASIHKLGKESVGYALARTEWVVEKETTTRASFVLGADGHQSRVRRELGIGFDALGPSQLFAIFELPGEKRGPDELHVVLDERTSVLWPLGDGRYRWSFEIDDSQAEEAARDKSRLVVVLGQQSFDYLDPAMLRRLAGERAPWLEVSGNELAWSIAARFERRLASELGRGVGWLAGDAAHLAPPMAVQSMNAGLWEARELCELLHAVLRRGGRRDALARLGAEWARGWRRLLAPAESIEATSSAAPWVRENAARIVDSLPVSGEHQRALLGTLGLRWKA